MSRVCSRNPLILLFLSILAIERVKQDRRLTLGSILRAGLLVLLIGPSLPIGGQIPKLASAPATAQPELLTDPLGRATPRGAVLGFLAASRKGADELAVQYLNTRLRGNAATELAQQLFVVLDRRLPAKLQNLSGAPEGSLSDALKPNQDLVGTISHASGDVDVLVERLNRGASGEVWVFSRETLDQIPGLYEETGLTSLEDVLPAFLLVRVANVQLFQLVAFFAGLPLLYLTVAFANRSLCALVGLLARRVFKKPNSPNSGLLPPPARLLVLPLIIHWTISNVSLPLLARQFWSGAAAILMIASCVWLLILWNARSEGYLRKRLAHAQKTGATSIVRFARRAVDLLLVFLGILALLRYFGVNATAALAGLGVGGIAVALAAQKTLENVIGGFSIIFDKAVHVGEFLRCGETLGTVEEIGLRSTRMRTPDRTVVSIPNGQIANFSLEDMSCRDKFWFRHILGLRYDTTASQMRAVLEELGSLLAEHPLAERESVRVRFVRFGQSSLELEIHVYLRTGDFLHFLEVQSGLLLRVMEIVQAAGTHIALQTPIITSRDPSSDGQAPSRRKAIREVVQQSA
jgi:MscS family membrane protein